MRGVAYTLGALTFSALMSLPAAAGCYGSTCDYYRSSPATHYRSSTPSYERYEKYVEGPSYYRSYRERYYDRPKYRTTHYSRPQYYSSSYERPRYHTTYYERPSYSTTYSDGSYYNSSHHNGSHYNNSYTYVNGSYGHHYQHHNTRYGHHYRPYYSTVRYGGAWSQTGPGYGYGGCHAAYIPYGWTWYRATNC